MDLSIPTEWRRGEFLITTDKTRFDLDAIHAYLSRESYWAREIPRQVVERSLTNSLAFALLHGTRQIGLARLVTDRATFAWLGDVYVLSEFRGQGLSKWLMEVIIDYPEVQGLRRWLLATADAHSLYERFGYKPLARPERFMERHFPSVYGGPPAG